MLICPATAARADTAAGGAVVCATDAKPSARELPDETGAVPAAPTGDTAAAAEPRVAVLVATDETLATVVDVRRVLGLAAELARGAASAIEPNDPAPQRHWHWQLPMLSKVPAPAATEPGIPAVRAVEGAAARTR